MKGMLLLWSAFWSLALGLIFAGNSRWIAANEPDLRETTGVIASERTVRSPASAAHRAGSPPEDRYEVRVVYEGKEWLYTGPSRAPARVGETVELYVSTKDPRMVYFKERLKDKASAVVFAAGWCFLVLVPWILAAVFGLLRNRDVHQMPGSGNAGP